MNIEITNANLVKEDYDILINFLDRMNFNYTTNEGEERKFSLKEALEIWEASGEWEYKRNFGSIPIQAKNKHEYFKDKFNIDI